MNFLIYLDAEAGELEKILSRVKTMIIKEFDQTQPDTCQVKPGDTLFFLKSRDDTLLRVKATVTMTIPMLDSLDGELCQVLKELQPKLQLTKAQFSFWSTKKQVILVEFSGADKINAVRIAAKNDTPGTPATY